MKKIIVILLWAICVVSPVALADTASLDSTVIKEQRADGTYIWKLTARSMDMLESSINLHDSSIEIYSDKGIKTAVIESASGSYNTTTKVITLSGNKIHILSENITVQSPAIVVTTEQRQIKFINVIINPADKPGDKITSRELYANFNLNRFIHKGFELVADVRGEN